MGLARSGAGGLPSKLPAPESGSGTHSPSKSQNVTGALRPQTYSYTHLAPRGQDLGLSAESIGFEPASLVSRLHFHPALGNLRQRVVWSNCSMPHRSGPHLGHLALAVELDLILPFCF